MSPKFQKTLVVLAWTVAALLLLSSFFCSIAALRLSLKTSSQMDTLSQDYLNFATKVETHMASIDDNLTFLRDYCTSAPNITLGDTYINRPHSKVRQ